MASRQVTSGASVVLLEPEVLLLELDVVVIGPVVDVEPTEGTYFSSESKQAPSSHTLAPSAQAPRSSRGDRADQARGPESIGATVASNRAPDDPITSASAIRTHPRQRGGRAHATASHRRLSRRLAACHDCGAQTQ